MARSSLFSELQRLLKKAESELNKEGSSFFISRRNFLKATGIGLAGLTLIKPSLFFATPSQKPKIAIVGAGLAGLTAAFYLQKSGLTPTLFEANSRAGGRVLTLKDFLAPGIHTEMGGEFVDSNHTDLIELTKELGLGLAARHENQKNLKTAYYFDKKVFSEDEVIQNLKKFLIQIKNDRINSLEKPDKTIALKLDQLSITQYLDQIGCQGWGKKFIETAFTTEFGLEPSVQSSLNLISMIDLSSDEKKLELYGSSDERYRIKGGSEELTQGLLKKLTSEIKYENQLQAISQKDSKMILTFSNSNQALSDVEADFVLLTLPFSLLRKVDIKINLPEKKKKAINELGYGTNSKIFLGTNAKVWLTQQYTGEIFTDEAFQTTWDEADSLPSKEGALTFFLGGKTGENPAELLGEQKFSEITSTIDTIFPGFKSSMTGKKGLFQWNTNPFSLGSYACYKTGQWTEISGNEFSPVGNLFFAGEHTSSNFQGFMNGAVETGKKAAEMMIQKIAST